MSESNVAQDELQAYVRRIESVEDELAALNSDKSEIYKEARSNGFDTKILRKVVSKRRLGAVEREEQDTIFDLYWDAVHAVKSEPVRAHVENIEEFPVKSVVSALRADPALAIVEPAILESKLQKVQTAQTEPQPAPQAGSDLTVPPSPQGQVAQIPAAVEAQRSTPVIDVGGSGDAIQPETANEDDAACANTALGLTDETGLRVEASDAGSSNGRTAAFDAVNAGSTPAPASKYAEPGVVVWEHTPPQPARRHPYSEAFGVLGQDLVVIDDDIAGAKSDPIVRIGNEILDGWARYNVARGMIGGSGISTEYPVMQYAGSDPLMDCIRLNMAGRMLSDKEKQTVVQRLSVLAPERKREIIKAVAGLAI